MQDDDISNLSVSGQPNPPREEVVQVPIDLDAIPYLDDSLSTELIDALYHSMPGAGDQGLSTDPQEISDNFTASKFLLLRDKDPVFYEGMLAGMMGALTLINLYMPGITGNKRTAVMYRVVGKLAGHVWRSRHGES